MSNPSLLCGPRVPMRFSTASVGSLPVRLLRTAQTICKKSLTQETRIMIPPTYKPKTKFMQLAIAEAKRARDRGDYAIGAVITQLIGNREVVIASAGNRVKTSGSSIKHVELETLKY